MGSEIFNFRHFSVCHAKCAMKVGTDGVLLGAWAELPETGKVLDIGTGSGLIALMMAQRRPKCKIIGIDVDPDAVLQAKENAARSPFAERITILREDVLSESCRDIVEAIVCNPPFFSENTLPPDPSRATARNTSCLPFKDLVQKVSSLLKEGGSFSVIIPMNEMVTFITYCIASELFLVRRTYVRTVLRKEPKRVLLTFLKSVRRQTDDTEIVLTENGVRSTQYSDLCKDFYL